MRRQGFALVMVMVGLVALGTVGALLAVEGKTEVRLSRAVAERAQAEAAAEGGLHKALALFRHPDVSLRWTTDGTPQTVTLDDSQVTVRVWDEGGKVDLNHATPELLAALFTGATADAGLGKRLARGVVAARRVGGFQSLGELRRLDGMEEGLYARLADVVTIHTLQQGIDTAVAPAALMALLAAADGGPEIPVSFRTQSRRRVFMIQAEARTRGGSVFRRMAVVRLLHADGRPFVVHAWE